MLRRMIGFIAALLLSPIMAGCSFQATLDSMVDRARQQEIVATAQTLCANPQSLQAQFHPDLWARSVALFPQVPGQCPGAGATYTLTGYNFSTSADINAPTQRTEEAVVIAGTATGPWSIFELRYQQSGEAPRQIMQWNMVRSVEKPEGLTVIETWDGSVNLVRFIGVVVVALIIGGIWWLIRRRRRRKALQAANAGATAPPTP